MKIEELQEKIGRLHNILKEPEPGMFTYHMAVQHMMEDLFEAWSADGDSDKSKVLKICKDAVEFQGKIYSNNTRTASLLGFSWKEALKFLESN
jgi:hypothetical protein